MEINAFYCPVCECNTRHIEVHLSEVSAVSGQGKYFQVLQDVIEGNPIAGLLKSSFGRRFWKCCECTSIYLRNNSGDIEDVIKQGEPNHKSQSIEKVFISQNTLNVIVNNTTINNYYVTGAGVSNYPWKHQREGFVGMGLDKYKLILHGDELPTFEEKKGLAGELHRLKILNIERHEIEWNLSKNRNKLVLENLTFDDARGIFDKLSSTKFINYLEII